VGNRGSRIALDVDNLFVLDVNELAASDGAIGADRTYDAIGVFSSRHQAVRSRGSGGAGQTEEVAILNLAGHGPLLKHIRKTPADFDRFSSKEMGRAEHVRDVRIAILHRTPAKVWPWSRRSLPARHVAEAKGIGAICHP